MDGVDFWRSEISRVSELNWKSADSVWVGWGGGVAVEYRCGGRKSGGWRMSLRHENSHVVSFSRWG